MQTIHCIVCIFYIFLKNLNWLGLIPIHKSVATLLWIETQTQYGFLNQEMTTPFLDLVLRKPNEFIRFEVDVVRAKPAPHLPTL